MKKSILFVAAIAALSFTSCKKDRTCTCTTSNSNATASTTTTITYTKSKKGDARLFCMSTKETEKDGSTTTTDCKLK